MIGSNLIAPDKETPVVDRLVSSEPLVSVELRPPKSGLGPQASMEAWIDMHHAIRKLSKRDTLVFLTDNAVGSEEEENLHHLMANVGEDADLRHIVPFLTCKHSLDYCQHYARRAASHGFSALTVLGGDKAIGYERCFPHAYQLRQFLRKEGTHLNFGGWANPHHPVDKQVDYLLDGDFEAEFFLTQIVSHHSVKQVAQFVNATRRRGLTLPGVFGVFYYRSANPATLQKLNDFFPVPADGITRDFEKGLSPEDVLIATIRALRDVGADKVYVSNLGIRRLDVQYRRILTALDAT